MFIIHMANVMTVREVLKKKKNPLHAHHFKNRGAKEMHFYLEYHTPFPQSSLEMSNSSKTDFFFTSLTLIPSQQYLIIDVLII